MGTQGCVSFMFQEKGELVIEKDGRDEDEMMMMMFKKFTTMLSCLKVGKNKQY